MKTPSRRKFIASAAGLAAVTTLSPATAMVAEEKVIAHQVYFWLKNPASSEDRAQLIRGLKTLQKIESVRKLLIGVVAATDKRPVVDDSWGVSALALFSDIAGEAAYQVHPIHLAFVKDYSHLWSKVVVYDSSEV
ncbi:MAG TPA: Dabb family protein [Daejeonella sp.]